jgi:hypothetical protein
MQKDADGFFGVILPFFNFSTKTDKCSCDRVVLVDPAEAKDKPKTGESKEHEGGEKDQQDKSANGSFPSQRNNLCWYQRKQTKLIIWSTRPSMLQYVSALFVTRSARMKGADEV